MFDYLLVRPLGWLLGAIYNLVNSYGFAIIIFTLITKIVLLPLAIKQQKSQVMMMKMRPKEEEIRKRHANSKEKLNEAIMKLYKEEKYSPLSGCLPLIIQLPLIWALYSVIRSPLSYVMGLSKDVVKTIVTALGLPAKADQLTIAREMANFPDKVASFLHGTKLIEFNFFGIDLTVLPKLQVFDLLWIIPILSGVTAYFQSFYQQRTNPMPEGQAGGSTMKTMMYFMPLMSVYIAFILPAGVGLYWIASNVFTIIQMVILNRYYNPRKIYQEELAKLALERANEKANEKASKKISSKKKASKKKAKSDEINEGEGE